MAQALAPDYPWAMFHDPASPPLSAPAPALRGAMQRASGEAAVTMRQRGGRTQVADLAQSGSARAMLPRVHGTDPEVVFLNTAGGLTGGDALRYSLDLGPGARAVATTQTAERAYDAGGPGGGRATMQVRLTLGQGAHADWLPQETILYDRAALSRRTRADLAPGASVLLAEMLVLGRAAMGEQVAHLALSDRREVWRGAVPVLVDPFALTDASLCLPGTGPRPALLAGARAVAMLALVAEGAEDAAAPLRAALARLEGAEAAVSGWDGRCLVRLRAPDGLPMRRAVARALHILRGGASLPRVWQI